ncbi:MAG: AAA family ATPase [Defluviitaleaceae bacterium]|nr:AAA family ATPase [Defluviitaleaceae bacterium]
MVLKKIKLKNFRCFGSDETTISFDDLTAFIGANSTGKTAAMQAIVKLFGMNQSEREIRRSDFHLTTNKSPDDDETITLSIEAVLEFPELEDESIPTDAVAHFFKYFVVDEKGQPPYLRILLESIYTKDGTIEGDVDTRYYFVTSSEKLAIEETDKRPTRYSSFSTIRCIYVPALRNTSEQLKNVSGTMLYRLLNSIDWEESSAALEGHMKKVNDEIVKVPGVSDLQDILQGQWHGFHNDGRYTNTKIEFNSTDMESALKTASIKFSPTEIPRDYEINELGDGLRSLFYFSLVNTLLRTEQKILESIEKGDIQAKAPKITPPVLTILVVEEPENHISPQLMGRVIKNIKDIATINNAQTVLSSHTPAIIKRIEATKIRHFGYGNDQKCSKVMSVLLPKNEDVAYKYVKEAVESYPEVYFARLVILGEGDSEMSLLPKVIEGASENIDVMGISVAPLGGRHVNHFWRLLNQLEIPHITLLDLDRERNGGGWGRIKYVIKQLLENGIDKSVLFNINCNDKLTDDCLEKMHEREQSRVTDMDSWIGCLEKYNIFFCAPLDLDFLMLEKYTETYKATIEKGHGPEIKGVGKVKDIEHCKPPKEEYTSRIKSSIKHTLKQEGGDGETYSHEQQKLMVWYDYLFLNRSKPVTHLKALSSLDFDDIALYPEPLNKIVQYVKKCLLREIQNGVGDNITQ